MSLFSDVVLGLEITRKMELSQDELAACGRVAQAVNHALDCALDLPITLDPRARSMIVEKLQESEHWLLELVRRAEL